MLKWLFTLVIALLVIGALTPALRRLGFGRVPGDITIERNGRQYSFAFGSTIVLSLVASLIFWLIR